MVQAGSLLACVPPSCCRALLQVDNCQQVLAVATVGNEMDSAMVDTLHGQEQKTFIAHYTCPSYAINEVSCLHLTFKDPCRGSLLPSLYPTLRYAICR